MTEAELAEALDAAGSHHEVVALLHDELGLTDADIARVARVRPMSVARWRRDAVEIRQWQRIDELRYTVVELLEADMDKKLLTYFLRRLDAKLGDGSPRRPLDALAKGLYEEVVRAGKTYLEHRRLIAV